MRILHLRNSDVLGGPERLLLDQAKRRAPDLEPAIAAFTVPGHTSPLLEAAAREGLETHAVAQRSSYDLRLVRRVRRLLESASIDLLVAHDYKANLVGRTAARHVGIPCVAVLHGWTGEDKKVRFFEALDRRALRRFDGVVVVSEAMERAALSRGVRPERLRRIENAIDVDAVRAAGDAGRAAARTGFAARPAERLLVALGRTSPEKGHATLFAALDVLAKTRLDLPAWRLVVVGDGADRRRLEDLAARGPLAGHVSFAGWRTDPEACLAAADLFVLPSHTEGLPLALLEAMALELPIVATSVGGVPVALDYGKAGLLVPPQDVEALARAIAEALTEAEPARLRAAIALDRVRLHYDTDRQTRELEDFYRYTKQQHELARPN